MSNRNPQHRPFDKYQRYGAYHWKECNRQSKNFNPPLVARYQVVVDQIASGSHVLEIGSGDGCLSASLADSGARVTGIELDRTAVELASRALQCVENCVIARASCYNLPFPSEEFDFAIMADVIEHLDEPKVALAEAARVLRRDGALIVTTPKWRPDRVWDACHVHEFTASELEDCLKNYFGSVDLSFFWPLALSNFYSTRVGWRALRVYARYFPNPFLRSGPSEDQFGQILAVCRNPLSGPPRKDQLSSGGSIDER